ncbi:acyl-CoA dehydrogenase family protein [Nonomuraea aurantiaca]|uniref:acyl-CoA dehydrogenase family protein n=1 Tax=Nonomuraea aurantiaca TaxID=2878562 RepID=UPI001CD93F85|nr:acyl-CoA dehydrogenase family protein [Nonomuraea aurantiaca]MCA2223065.1 acyl-CoA/acyl-ACP dehydrogenase [Nonomuraea aurantiaca]
MDFNLDETQQDLRTLTADLLAKEATQERLEAHEKSGRPYDERLWQALCQAGLMSVCVPEDAGGAGLGSVELAVVLREVGARAAPAPALATLVSTLALARYGTPEQQRPPADSVGTVALREAGRAPADPPSTAAERDGDGWVLTGRKVGVPYGSEAAYVLVAADEGVFLVTGGWTAHPEFAANGESLATVVLDRTPAERLAGPEAVSGLRQIFTAAVAAQASGVLAGALTLTTEYIKNRKQFGRALAEFQAVTVQIADVYIATRALDVAVWSGAWLLANDLPAEEDLAVAAFHVSEAYKALYTCQHLHGGLGLDVTYPLHRYFAHAKHLTHLLGGADAQLDLIGALV